MVHDQSAIAASMQIQGATAGRVSKAAPKYVRTPAVINLTYDPLASTTVAAQRDAANALLDQVEQTIQDTAQQILSDGLSSGADPEAIARALRQSLGMSMQEATAIENYRAALTRGERSPLHRALRDRRYDVMVRRGNLNLEQIDRMVERYAARYRAFRANRLAATTSLNAANAGRRAAWAQYATAARRTPGDIRRFWMTAADELVCARCAPIPSMNPDGIALDEQYATPIGPSDGPVLHPFCRCTERFQRMPGPGADQSISASTLRIDLDYGQ